MAVRGRDASALTVLPSVGFERGSVSEAIASLQTAMALSVSEMERDGLKRIIASLQVRAPLCCSAPLRAAGLRAAASR